ncbi:MAG: sugar ABC transporter permease [Clostridia bacterium]|nr:sugar ABC transporter permease [Clostridia bacterium]
MEKTEIKQQNAAEGVKPQTPRKGKGVWKQHGAYVKKNWGMYLMLLPGLLSLAIFTFAPMFGLYMAFIDYTPSIPIFQSENVGFLWFQLLFEDPLFWNMIKNTVILSTLKILVNFPLTIILSLLVYELEGKVFKRIFQSVSYLPNFISWIIISGMLVVFLDSDRGILNAIITAFGGKPVSWYSSPDKWYAILTITAVWKGLGWGTIMYIASMTSIDPSLYEAAKIDGAGKLRQAWHITLPGISGIISITLILTIGKIFTDDFEQIYALVGENGILQSTTQVISTKVFSVASGANYKDYPMATAMGLIQGIISLILVTVSNKVANKTGQTGLW